MVAQATYLAKLIPSCYLTEVNQVKKDSIPLTPHLPLFSPLRNKECPTCRKKLVSKRSLRHDPNFDALISKIYPSRDEYEAHQRRALDRFRQLHNPQPLILSIEEGIRLQAKYRSGGHYRVKGEVLFQY